MKLLKIAGIVLVFGLVLTLCIAKAGAKPGNGQSTATPTVNPGSPGDDCLHGNSNQDCRPDPNENGQDCEDHGNARGNEDHCLPSPSPTVSPSPSTSPTPTESPTSLDTSSPSPSGTTPTTQSSPSPVTTTPSVKCNPSVTLGPWHGDPLVNITLTGPGSFEIRGGKLRRANLHVVRDTLSCGEVVVVRRYHVMAGGSVRVYLNGTLVAQDTAPTLGR